MSPSSLVVFTDEDVDIMGLSSNVGGDGVGGAGGYGVSMNVFDDEPATKTRKTT